MDAVNKDYVLVASLGLRTYLWYESWHYVNVFKCKASVTDMCSFVKWHLLYIHIFQLQHRLQLQNLQHSLL